MSDVPNSISFIQQESINSAQPVASSVAYAMGGSINYTLTNAGQVGDVVMSGLDQTTFQALRDATWVLCDGRAVPGSDWETLTSLPNIPDFRGYFPRGKDNGAGVNPDGELPIGQQEADTLVSHNHGYTDPEHAHDFGTSASGPGGAGPIRGDNTGVSTQTTSPSLIGITILNTGSAETRPKYTIINFFVKINT